MAFSEEPVRTPTSIGNMYITLTDLAVGTDTIRGVVEVRDQNDEVMRVWSGDLVPHLTAQQITQIQTFVASLRAQAADELLP